MKLLYKIYSYLRTRLLQKVSPNMISRKASIANNTSIMPGTMIDDNCKVGNHTYIGYNCCITKAKIGRYVSIANNVSIGSGEHNLERISTSTLFYESPYEELTKKEVIIGHDCWIGVDCIIRRGVSIGNGAVIGANSFVNKNVPDFAIVVGSPAKVIGYRFSSDQICLIDSSKWWEFDVEEAKNAINGLEKAIVIDKPN